MTNNMINGKKFTMQWYADDNKVTHVSEDVIIGFIYIVKKYFGELAVFRVNQHTFPGMDT